MRIASILVPLLGVTVLGITAPLHAASNVLVVAKQPGPGIDHTSIGAAVAAAGPGDVVLVKTGSYDEQIYVHSKSIAIASDGGPVVVTGRVHVAALPASSSFSLQGFDVFPSPAGSPIIVEDCAGFVLFERCRARGSTGLFMVAGAYTACRVSDCDAVVLSECELVGGDGAYFNGHQFPGSWKSAGPAAAGLSVESSSVTLHGCAAVGGTGGDYELTPGEGGAGGNGCTLVDSAVHASACRFVGGKGGDGWSQPDGAAGAALEAQSSSSAELVACLVSGAVWSQSGSSVTALALPAVELVVTATSQVGVKPLREGEVGTLEISGASGAFALLLVAPSAAYVPSASWLGTALVGAPLTVLPLGSLGPSASVAVPFVVPEQGVGVEGTLVHVQAATIDGLGALQLGEHRLALLLDASL